MAKTPKLVVKAAKNDVIRLRVTTDQKRALTAAAIREGLELSDWLRQLCLRAAEAVPDQK